MTIDSNLPFLIKIEGEDHPQLHFIKYYMLTAPMALKLAADPKWAKLEGKELDIMLSGCRIPLHDALNTSGKRIPAVQRFCKDILVYNAHYQFGSLQNPAHMIPAVESFDEDGQVTHKEFYQANELWDPAPGIPAKQALSNGKLLWAISYPNGGYSGHLSAKEVAAINKKRFEQIEIPEIFAKRIPDGLKPVP